MDEEAVRRIVREEIAAHVAELHERQIKVSFDRTLLARILHPGRDDPEASDETHQREVSG